MDVDGWSVREESLLMNAPGVLVGKKRLFPAEKAFRVLAVLAAVGAAVAIAGGASMGFGHARELPQAVDIGKVLALGGGSVFGAFAIGAGVAKGIARQQEKNRYMNTYRLGKPPLSKPEKAFRAMLVVAAIAGLTMIGGGIAMGVGHARGLSDVASVGQKVMLSGGVGLGFFGGGAMVAKLLAKRQESQQYKVFEPESEDFDSWG